MKNIQLFFKILLIPLDLIFCFFSFLLAYELRINTSKFLNYNLFEGYIPEIGVYIPFVFYVCFLFFIVFYFGGIYKLNDHRRTLEFTPKLILLVLVWLFFISSYFFWTRTFFFSRLVLVLGALFTFFFIILIRLIFDWIKEYSIFCNAFQKEVLLVGKSKLNKSILQGIEKDGEYKVLETFYKKEDLSVSKIKNYALKNNIHEIIQTNVGSNTQFDLKLLDFCQVENITYKFIPTLFDLHKKNIETRTINSFPLIELKTTPLDGWGSVLKRFFDIFFSLTALFILTPVFIIVSLLIKITSKGSIFVSLKRVRYKGVFQIYKFRSMVTGAHKLKKSLLEKNERKDGPLFKIKEDPRITKFGKIIRKTRIDEIPQFWNVLKGDMSLVGPRPHEPEEVEKYEKHHRKLLAIKPGLTGMAQTHGASDLSFDEEVKLDTYYIENWNIFLDIKIILKTFIVVIIGKGAA